MTSPSTIATKFLPAKDQLGLVAVGFSGGQCKPGVDAAPSALIESGLLIDIQETLEYTLYHDGIVHGYSKHLPSPGTDLPLHVAGAKAPMINPIAVSNVTHAICDQVYEHASNGRLVLTLGGDHSIAIGSVAGTAKAIRERHNNSDMALIWVDAHADINTPQCSGSGNIHGMPVAFLTGITKAPIENPDIFGWIKDEHRINPSKIVYIGLRDVDIPEKKILRDHGIRAFSMHDIDRHGIGKVMDMALDHIKCGPGQEGMPIHLSFDVDALDPYVAPSTGTPVRGGLTLREGDFICEVIHETGYLVAMDLVEVNPALSGDGPESIGAKETIRAGCSLVRCALGESLL